MSQAVKEILENTPIRKTQRSDEIFSKARGLIPGGVNSPVRSFKAVGGKPFVVARGNGAYFEDIDGNRYLDLVGSWGALIHGHAHPEISAAIRSALEKGTSFGVTSEPEIELCELLTSKVKNLEMVRLVNSGTEACMSAIRLARGLTKRPLIVKFEGCYHGHGDSFLVAAGSGAATLQVPDSAGITEGTLKSTRALPFNDIDALEKTFAREGGEIAAVILEVVVGNMGVVAPRFEFLQKLRELCTASGALLIFDEVMTGFRLGFSGSQDIYPVKPDLMTFGKIMGGGLPIAAYGGKKEIMEQIAPLGPVYQAGTLSGNPLCASAGLASLKLILEDPKFYQKLDRAGHEWKSALESEIKTKSYEASVAQVGSMLTLFFTSKAPSHFLEAKTANLERFKKFFWSCIEQGLYYPPSQYEACFLSIKHTEERVLDELIQKSLRALKVAFE